MENRTRHPLAVASLVVFILCSSWLAIAQPTAGQPLPTEVPTREPPVTQTPAGVPTEEPTVTPTPSPTPSPTPRVTEVPTVNPTEVPTEVPTATTLPRATETPIPTTTPRPTAEPTEVPRVTPTPVPTEALPPALPPINNSGQGPNDLDENAVGSGYLTVQVRLCPPEYDTTRRPAPLSLPRQCPGLAWETTIRVIDPDYGPPQHVHVHLNEIASFTTSAKTQMVGVGGTWFEPVAITCVLPSNSPAVANTNPVLMPTIGSSGTFAEVPVLELKTTACTWYLHHPEPLAEVSVHLWSCSAGYDWTAAGSDPSTDCTQPVDGEYVSISAQGASVASLTGTTAPGMITFTSIPPGEYKIYYVNPLGGGWQVDAGWDYLGACGGDPVVSVEDLPFHNQAEIPATVPSGGAIDCSFYRVPPA